MSTTQPKLCCSVYEIDGRLLVRTVDFSDGLGLERDDTSLLDGYPGIGAEAVGALVLKAMSLTKEVPRPTVWRKRSEYAALLLAASPGRYRSLRSWQRAARHVSVDARDDAMTVFRWHADSSRGGWMPAGSVGRPVGDWPQELHLPRMASPSETGAAVLAALAQPSLRDG